MTALNQQLRAILDAIQVSPLGGLKPGTFGFGLSPLGELKVAESVPAVVNLTWITKDVRFTKVGPEPALQGVPVDPQAVTTAIEGALVPAAPGSMGGDLPGVPGVLGQLIGQLPMQVSTDLPVTVKVAWRAESVAGGELKVLSTSQTQATFALAPAIVSDDGSSAPTRTARVWVDVTLTVDPPALDPIIETRAIGPLDVPVPALRIPTILALWNHGLGDLSEHGGVPPCILIAVKNGPTLADVGAVVATAQALATTLSTLSGSFPTLPEIGSLAAVASGLNRVASLLSSAQRATKKYIVVRQTSAEHELHRIVFYTDFLYTHSGEDTFSSLFLVGLPSQTVRFYNARFRNGVWDTSEGAFNLHLRAGEPIVFIESLHGALPATTPPGAATNHRTPPSGSFGDRISAFQFL